MLGLHAQLNVVARRRRLAPSNVVGRVHEAGRADPGVVVEHVSELGIVFIARLSLN